MSLFSQVLKMLYVILLLTLCFRPTSFYAVYLDAPGGYNARDTEKNCICVPYWQCKEDFSGLVEDGMDIIDIRALRQRSDGTSCNGDFDVCCRVECGKLNNGLIVRASNESGGLRGRILDGRNNAGFAEFPWMLGVMHDYRYKCGASLIHPRVAVTAAHCISGRGKYKVRAGEWDWKSSDEPLGHQDRSTEKIVVHPRYNPYTLQNDIALLILDEPFRLTENVGVICLPRRGPSPTTRRCVVSGWGRKSHKGDAHESVLKKLELPMIPHGRCTTRLRNPYLGPYFRLHRSFVCAGGEDRRDTCKGDGGSPLVCAVTGHPDRYEQVGIVSWGLTCGLHDAPGVYVNVGLFSGWIDEQMTVRNLDTLLYRA